MTYALGIDLGTTFTAAAVSRNGRVETVGLGNHAATVPSAVFLRADGELLVGDAAQRRGLQEPERLAREFKRRFGDSTPIMLGHTPYSAERLMATVLRQIVDQVSERYGGPPKRYAIAHPANWGPYKIELLHQAVQLAGLDNVDFVTEPEAAAMHYAASERVEPGEIVAVYDLGGGTFDAAVLQRTDTGFVTLGQPQGIERLGGIDFDQAVLSHVSASLGSQLAGLDQSDPTVRAAMSRLREECVAAKESLSEDSETTISVMLPGVQTQVRLTRREFEDVIRPPVRETVTTLQRAITSSGVAASAIKAIVLAGGSSRIPLVAEMLRSEVGRPVVLDAHPKHTVALGAARLAEQRATAAPAPSPPIAAVFPPPPPNVEPPGARTSEADSAGAADTVPQNIPVGSPPAVLVTSWASGGKRRGALIGAGALVVVAIVAAVAVTLSGSGDKDAVATDSTLGSGSQTTTGATTVASSPSTTVGVTSSVSPACAATSGRCVVIDSITTEGDHYVIAYSTIAYGPKINGTDADHHIHFFYDNIPASQSGAPGSGPWLLWDLDENGKKFYRGYKIAEAPEGATSICAVVATHAHALDPGSIPGCRALP